MYFVCVCVFWTSWPSSIDYMCVEIYVLFSSYIMFVIFASSWILTILVPRLIQSINPNVCFLFVVCLSPLSARKLETFG